MRVSVHHHPAGRELAPHRHDAPTLSIVVAGRQREIDASGARELGPLSVASKDAGHEHENRILDVPLEAIFVELPVPAPPVPPPTDAPELILSCARLAWLVASDTAVPATEVRGVLSTLGRLRTAESAPDWLRGARHAVLQRSHETWARSEIAETCGVHEGHLARGFRSWFGCSVTEFARIARTAEAALDLATGETAITAIAADHGFADQSHMTRVFGRLVGTSPAAFRRSVRRCSFRSRPARD